MDTHGTAALEARGISKIRGERWVLSDVSLAVPPRGLTHLRGANGAGKTTLLRILAGELAPSRGEVLVEGRPLGPGPGEGRHRLVFVPEALAPSPWLTGDEYLAFRLALRGTSDEELARTIEDFDLGSFVRRPMATLSGGERRRVVLAAALTSPAAVVLLDEPTANVDARHCDLLAERLRREAGTRAVLVATHLDRTGIPEPDATLTLVDGRLEGAP